MYDSDKNLFKTKTIIENFNSKNQLNPVLDSDGIRRVPNFSSSPDYELTKLADEMIKKWEERSLELIKLINEYDRKFKESIKVMKFDFQPKDGKYYPMMDDVDAVNDSNSKTR